MTESALSNIRLIESRVAQVCVVKVASIQDGHVQIGMWNAAVTPVVDLTELEVKEATQMPVVQDADRVAGSDDELSIELRIIRNLGAGGQDEAHILLNHFWWIISRNEVACMSEKQLKVLRECGVAKGLNEGK